MAYNKLILQGNLTKDNELRYLPNGSSLVKNSIAVTEKYKTKDGQQKEENLFLDFTIFGKSAETFNQYTQKGSKVLLDGSLKLESWQAQDGSNRQKHSLKVDNFTFLDSKQNSQTNNYAQQNKSNSYQEPPVEYQNNIPEIDIDEKEIPF